MKVLKFGGTSVGTVASLRNVKKIVDGLPEPAVIVVSALGGLTDQLISTARMAAENAFEYRNVMKEIRERHLRIVDEMIPENRRVRVWEAVSILLGDLENLYTGISLIRDVPEKTLAAIVSYGERMSSIIVAGMLENADHYDSLDIVRTEKWFERNIADRALTDKRIKETFELPLARHAVMGGFISTDRNSGEITNLGRGGSDYTAALVAAALNAGELEIWTDVDGFLTTDPRIIPDARIIDSMTFIESMELCNFGAKVIYPPTIYPVFHKNIPIKILNTFNSTAPGTLISDHISESARVCGISMVNNMAIISIEGKLTSNVAEINSRAYNVMARHGISVAVVCQPMDNATFMLSLSGADSDKAVSLLQADFMPEISAGTVSEISLRKEQSLIAVVGEGIKQLKGLGARLTNTLERNGIEVRALSDGPSETTIAIAVDTDVAKKALSLVHSSCFN